MKNHSLITILLTIFMSMMGRNAFAYDIEVKNADGVSIYYDYINDGKELEVSYFKTNWGLYNKCYRDNIVIPEEVTYMNRTRKVTSIGSEAFLGSSLLNSVTIPKTVTSIGNSSFAYCSELNSIVIEDGNPVYDSRNNCNAIIKTANNELVWGCKNTLIPNSVSSIGNYAFCGSGVTSLTIPDYVMNIGEEAFYACISLKSITISNNVTSIEKGVFHGCSSLKSIIIPNKVTSIGENAFKGCSSLESVNIPNGVTAINGGSFSGCYNLNSVIIPNSVTSIGGSAFWECTSLKSITIPTSVTNIGESVFYGCKSLESINIPDGVTSINKDTFLGCSSLNSVIIPNSVTSIGGSAFRGCTSFKSITVPNSVTSLGDYAFAGCNKMTSVTIGNGVKTIAYGAFMDCEAITSVNISDIAAWCKIQFNNNNYSTLDYSNPLVVASHLYVNSEEIKDLVIPNSVTVIRNGVFNGCSLNSVTIPNSVTHIGSYAFNYSAIPTIVSLIEEPFILNGHVFSENTIKNATLYVPVGTIEKYKATEGWKDFVFIEEGAKPFKLIYTVDGETIKTIDLQYGVVITPEPEPIKEGYTFSGWSEIPETMPDHDVTVTGTFTINKYKLVYMVDGEDYKSYEIEYGTSITPEAEPAKEGYFFSGWSNIPATMPANDITVTGTFTKGAYKLTYIVDGVVYKIISYDYGTTITPEAEPTKEGYTFSGWSEIPETMPAMDVTITGTFTINKYKLTYLVDGMEYKSYEIEYGTSITPEAEPTKEGYTFSSWSDIPETMPGEDVTITGTFTINKYMFTYYVDGEVFESYEVEYGASITPETEPTKEGYTFSGWSWIPETMPAKDVMIAGEFYINSYKLTYMIDDDVYKEVTYEYGATITPEQQPEGNYETFEWTDLPQTMPAHDVVVYANYTTGIVEVLMSSQRNVRIYSPKGKKLNKLQKGLNIFVFDDGTVHKKWMK